jgi:hypothetical protein
MPIYGQGMSEALYVGYETTPGVTPATFNAFKIPVMNPSWKPSITKFSSTALSGSAEPRPPVFGKIGSAFTFELEGSKDSYGPPMKCFFGTPQDQGLTPLYDHYFTLGSMISGVVEERHTDTSQNFLVNGNYFGQFDLTVDPEGIAKATFGGMGLSTTNEGAATAINGSITDLMSALPLSMVTATIKQGGVALGYVQQFAVKANRGLGSQNHIDGTKNIGVIFSQIASIGGTMRVSFQDKALLDLALNSTETNFEVDILEVGTGCGLQLIFPTAILEPSMPVASGTGLVPIDFNWSAYARGTASDVSAELLGMYIGLGTIVGLSTKTLVIAGDAGADETFTMTVTEEGGLAAVVTKINATSVRVTASVENGRLKIASKTFGTTSSVRIQAASTGDVLLGMIKAVTYAGFSGKSMIAQLTNNRATV